MQRSMTSPATILCGDWAKGPGKRAVWAADVDARRIYRVAARGGEGWTFRSLVEEAERRGPAPRLVAIDAVLGVPNPYFDRRREVIGWEDSSNFIDWLPRAARTAGFFETASNVRQWSMARPFFAMPRGVGARRSFIESAGFDLLRSVERECRGSPGFVVSGIPGSVGSASRALWQELAPMLESKRTFRVWPFEGNLNRLLREARIAVGEMYPRIAYAVATARELPTRPEAPRKKARRSVREDWLSRLRTAPWIRGGGVTIADEAAALSSEDDFDALFAAAALLRCVVESVPLASDHADGRAEGGILGTEAVRWTDRTKAPHAITPASISSPECHNRERLHR
jgi:hypothetical protein